MRRAPLLFSLLAVPTFAACGYTADYQGRIVDGTGKAQRGLAVTLRDIGFSDGHYTDADVIARAEVVETVNTDEDGRFTLQHTYGGSFGCGISSVPALVIAPDGPTGEVAVALGIQNEDHHADVGTIRLIGAIDATADQDGVYLAPPSGRPKSGLVRVDGTTWLVGEDGVLPAEALEPCDGACEHEVAYVAQDEHVYQRSAVAVVVAEAPSPELTAMADVRGSVDVKSFDPLVSPEIFIDGLYSDDQLTQATTPTPSISVASDADGTVLQPLPPGACTVYGGGMRCSSSSVTRLSALHVEAVIGSRVRVYSR